MGLGEADTRAKLIDPALHSCGSTEGLIRREETAGAVEIAGDRPRRRARGRDELECRQRGEREQPPGSMLMRTLHSWQR